MVKKVTSPQAKSLKTINKNHHQISSSDNDKKKQLNSLIKVLRPKVYITDRDNFKKLVQELTGNGSGSGSSSGSRKTEEVIENNNKKNNIPVIDIIEDDDGGKQGCMEIKEACSFDASFDSFDEGFREADNQIYLNDEMNIWSKNQLREDCLAYQDIESWLLDVDHPCPSINNGFEQNLQVSIYDYELSRLI